VLAMTDDPRFLACLPFTLKEEGGNSDDPHDPGGRTHKGIIQREYNAWRQAHNESMQDVYNASDEEVNDIYYQQYWLPYCPQFPAGLDLCFFDLAVNGGPAEAVKILQRALGVNADGHLGLVTMGALKTANVAHTIVSYTVQREAFYRSLRLFKYFGRDWIGRSERIETAALKMLPTGE
jgi:lysozyme family protein